MSGWDRRIGRREILKKGLLGAAGLAALPVVAAACGSVPATTSASPAPPSPTAVAPTPAPATPTPAPTRAPTAGTTIRGACRFGFTPSEDPNRLMAMNRAASAFMHANPEFVVKFEDLPTGGMDMSVLATLDTEPADLAEWFAGSRLQQLGAKGLISPVDRVWEQVKDNYPEGFTSAVRAPDGHVYGLPIDFYPWAFFYRKSVWADHGYVVPKTWAQLLTLCARMKADGLTPIELADRDGWPAMATFDYLNLRLNGYDFHMDLLAGKQKWTDPRVTTVFERWREMTPFCSKGAAGRTWQEAADALGKGAAGMYLLGTFVVQEAGKGDPTGEIRQDLDLFPFPTFGNAFDGENAIEAPFDVIIMCARSKTLEADRESAEAYLKFWGRGDTQWLLSYGPNRSLPVAMDADVSSLPDLERRSVELLRGAKRITNFFDRDSRPEFAGAQGMQNFLLKFLGDPAQDLVALQRLIQDFWDALPPLD